MAFLDFFFPKYCVNCKKFGSYLCSDCFVYISFDNGGICLSCSRFSIEGMTHPSCRGRFVIDGALASLSDAGVTKKLIYSFKYKPYVSDLKTVVGELFYEGIIQKELFNKVFSKDAIFVPIPLYSSKLRKRGYNQSKILAQDLAKRFNCRVLDVLTRVKNTKSQYGLKRDERKENLDNAFGMMPNISISKYPVVFLVDDILTTGSTMLAAAKILKKSGAMVVWGVALARD